MFAEQQIAGGDGALNLVRGPAAGPPLLFLHGVGRRWQDFAGLMTSLSSRWQVFGVDFRGHGQSGRTPGKYQVRDYIRDAVAVARYIDRPLVIYGHSLGAMVTVGAAAELGQQARAVVLEDPPFVTTSVGIEKTPFHGLFKLLQSVSGSPLPVAQLARQMADSRVPAEGKPEGVRLGDVRELTSIRFGAACLKKVDPELWNPVLAGGWLEGFDYRAALRQVSCPALLLQGNVALGGMVRDEDAADINALLPDCTHVPFPQTGHLIHNMLPEQTLRIVTEFLDALGTDAAAQ